ncbi:hypothetical protein IEQ34_020566 [Dendrobium chrysotoxum]|uniref:Uncharacterized protein n=1 Tax=Dendrobium chrysotoxum TaxID=161865 RepID=A0AAV7G1C6_DENCH|nr:hypothetical protein IEQ34_020566 [Dendrobium chrysotoxum]
MEDEQLPSWAQRIFNINQGVDLQNLTVKVIEASDISSHHNCFTLQEGIVRIHLIPYLTIEERGKAGFIVPTDLDCSTSSAQRIGGGLKVTVYVRAGRRVADLLLIHSDEVGGTVITGDNMEALRNDGKFREGELVEIWMFRLPPNYENTKELCFIFVKVH